MAADPARLRMEKRLLEKVSNAFRKVQLMREEAQFKTNQLKLQKRSVAQLKPTTPAKRGPMSPRDRVWFRRSRAAFREKVLRAENKNVVRRKVASRVRLRRQSNRNEMNDSSSRCRSQLISGHSSGCTTLRSHIAALEFQKHLLEFVRRAIFCTSQSNYLSEKQCSWLKSLKKLATMEDNGQGTSRPFGSHSFKMSIMGALFRCVPLEDLLAEENETSVRAFLSAAGITTAAFRDFLSFFYQQEDIDFWADSAK